ncbi:MAG: beta-lactamase family protein, partial [Eudoraea sp.]|nr:beta-lactamase family protein [Eudoraea sp.]
MKRQLYSLLGILFLISTACSKGDKEEDSNTGTDPISTLYFPLNGEDEWETVSPAELNWNTAAQQPLLQFLEENGTKAFLILKDGKIAMEAYYENFDKDSVWYWASAGKTLTAFTVGIAQEKNLLNIENKSSFYLGEGWTTATPVKEDLITVRHQLTMTSGLNDTSFDCTSPDCLEYIADAGTRWAYHNGPYTLLQSVVSEATNTPWSAFFNTHLRNKIGMNGFWLSTNGENSVYFSNARSMARFGLLNLNNGVWDGETILADVDFITNMINTSQELNKSYGYLWWLNGKESYMA